MFKDDEFDKIFKEIAGKVMRWAFALALFMAVASFGLLGGAIYVAFRIWGN